jgi:hypothetical protein
MRCHLWMAFCLIACLCGPPSVAGDEISPPQTYRLQESWTIVDDGNQPFLFGILEDVLIDRTGRVFVLDSQLSEVKVFDADGRFIRNMGGRGEGPGEFTAAGHLATMPDGSVGVVSKMLAKVIMFDPDTGHPRAKALYRGPEDGPTMLGKVSDFSAGRENSFVAVTTEMLSGKGRWGGRRGQLYNGRVCLAAFDYRTQVSEYPVRVLAEVGRMTGSNVEEEAYYNLWKPWTVDSLGRLVLAPFWGEYRLQYFDADATLVQECRFPFTHRQRRDYEKDRCVNYLWGGVSPDQFGIPTHLADTEAVVRELIPRPEGDVWVRTNRSGIDTPEGVVFHFDAVDPSGQMKGAVQICGEGDGDLDRYYFGPNNKVIRVKNGEGFIRTARGKLKSDEVYDQVITCYELVREVQED